MFALMFLHPEQIFTALSQHALLMSPCNLIYSSNFDHISVWVKTIVLRRFCCLVVFLTRVEVVGMILISNEAVIEEPQSWEICQAFASPL